MSKITIAVKHFALGVENDARCVWNASLVQQAFRCSGKRTQREKQKTIITTTWKNAADCDRAFGSGPKLEC